MAVTIHDNWNGESGMFADQMHESDKPTHSQILGPDGKRLAYKTQRLGFDLKPQVARIEEQSMSKKPTAASKFPE